jgi:hypothetical protein
MLLVMRDYVLLVRNVLRRGGVGAANEVYIWRFNRDFLPRLASYPASFGKQALVHLIEVVVVSLLFLSRVIL